MLRRNIKVLAAAAVLGISPALLSAQSPLEGVGGQLESQSKAAGQITNPAPKVPGKDAQIDANSDLDAKSQLNNKQLDAKSKLDAKSQLDTDSQLKSKTQLDAKAKGNTRGLQTPPQTPEAADGAIQNTPGNVQMKGKVQGNADADLNQPLRHQTNRPQTFDNQNNAGMDDVVRQGTAHLNLDDATRARYRHHNGHWWYKTEQGAWLIYNNNQWEPFDPVTYRNPGQPMDQDYYQDDDSYQSSNYYDDGSYYQGGTYYNPGYYNNGYGNFYRGNRYYNGRGYGRGYYNNRGNGYNGNWGSGYRGLNRSQRQGAAIGAGIGGAIGGNQGAAIGAGIGAGVAD